MKPLFRTCLAASILTLPVLCQTPAQLRTELRAKESAAAKDPDKLLEIAKWTEESGLVSETKRILQGILRIDPDHEGANLAMGNVLHEGKWMSASDAEALRKKALEAEYKQRGLVQVDGVWVEKEHVADAKKGVFHHDGQRVTLGELQGFQAGKVRHPKTGQLIEAADLDKAETMFPIGVEVRWATEKEADVYHRDRARPWVVRTTYCVVVSTLPFKDLQDARREVDVGYETVRPFLASLEPTPKHRPVIIVAATDSEYRDWGNEMGDAASAYGAFLSTGEASVRIPNQGETVPAVCHWHKDWGPYWARHAAGLAYLKSLCQDTGIEVPAWFQQGFGAYASRFTNPYLAGYFGEQHVQKGGVKDLKAWFNSFQISGEMEPKAIDANIYQAGLMVSFATRGGEAKVVDAMMDITKTFESGKARGADKAVDKLEKLLIQNEDEIRSYLQTLIRDKGR